MTFRNDRAGDSSASYTVDGARIRIKRVSGGTTTIYVFSGSKVVAEYENGAAPNSPACEYIHLGSQLLAKIEGGRTRLEFHTLVTSWMP